MCHDVMMVLFSLSVGLKKPNSILLHVSCFDKIIFLVAKIFFHDFSMFYLRHGASPVGNLAALASAKVANRTTIDEVILI